MNEDSVEEEPHRNIMAQLGISVEPLAQIQQQLLDKHSGTALVVSSTPITQVSITVPPNEMVKFAQKMLENLFNYALSFEKTITSATFSAVQAIPTEVLKKWYQNFETK